MESEAIVARVDGQMAFVEVRREASGCGRCSEAGGCGSSLLSQILGGNRRLYRLPNLIAARPGDSVVLSVGEGMLLRAALWTYALPMLAAITGAALGTALWVTDIAAVAGACLALILALLIQRRAFGHVEPLLSMRLKSPVINHSEDALS